MKSIRKYVKKYWYLYFIGIISMVAAVSLDMLTPQVTKHVIDDVIVDGKTELLFQLLLILVVVGLGRAVFQYLKELFFDMGSSKVAVGVRKDLFCHIERLSLRFFQKNNTGELMARVKDDVDRLWNLTSYVSMLVIEVVIHCSFVLFCMFQLNWALTIVPLLIVPAVAVMAIRMEKKLDATYGDISEENAILNTIAQENLGGVRTVKSFAREDYEIQKFGKSNHKYMQKNLEMVRTVSNYYPTIQFCTRTLLVLVVVIGGILTVYGKITLGSLGAFIEYTNNLVWPLEIIGWLVKDVAAAIASDKKIRKILEEDSEVKEVQTPVRMGRAKGNISFRHVSFSRKKEHIIQDISFSVQEGRTLGIMGATGSGKSTIIELLERFYDPEEGEIQLDGIDIRKLSLAELRENISLVMQDVFLFSDTIEENIQMGSAYDISSEEIRYFAGIAHASGFVEKMEEGYQTVIGERGIGLSGGQKQRISIARALAKKAPVLILDDSTSALDMETEKKIQKELAAMTDTTKIIIAHRISAVCDADEIIILRDGRIAERGTHEELLKKRGLYYETYEVQYG